MVLNIVSKVEQGLHDQIVESIARSRFDIDGWKVSVGTGPQTDVSADIIATNKETVVAIGEVETCESIDAKAAIRWRALGRTCSRFYLFVPEGTEKQVIELLEMFEVACAGLRCYAKDGNSLVIRTTDYDSYYVKEDNHEWWTDLGKG